MGEVFLTNRNFKDLNPIIFGHEECSSGKSFGPAIRKYTLIHYVEQGCGKLFKNGEEYDVRAGEAFIILPNEITFYQADKEDPWTYRWIGFDGTLSEKYKDIPPVVPVSNEIFPNIDQDPTEVPMVEYILASQLFSMTATLLSGVKHKNHYVRQVKNYISSCYMQDMSIGKLADHLRLDRRYLSRLFKEKTGETIQDYLTRVRMEEARRLLSLGQSVSEAASLCGYTDTCNFSKMFKKYFGTSPNNLKKRSQLNDK